MKTTGMTCVTCNGRLGVCSTQTYENTVTRYRKCLNCGVCVISEETIVRDGRLIPEVLNDKKKSTKEATAKESNTKE